MTSTVLDQPASPPQIDLHDEEREHRWTSSTRRAHGVDDPPIDRPTALTSHRVLLILVTVALLAVSFVLGVIAPDERFADSSLQLVALALGVISFVAGVVFAIWAFRRRTDIDDLRWLSFRRNRWGGWWSVVWTMTPVAALVAFSVIEAQTGSLVQACTVGIALVVIRTMSLDALGRNMKRVVLDGRRWVRAGALSVALADLLVVWIVWSALVQRDLDRELLRVPASILPMSVLLLAGFSLTYAKRIERWVLEWWDNRWGCTEQIAMDHFSDVALGGATTRFSGRRLVPTAPLRLLVVASYLALAAAAGWSGWTVWTLRDELGDAQGLTASLSRFDEVAGWFMAALLCMQVCHALWCVAQAWNARRCTLAAPSVVGTTVLFLLGPAIVAGGVLHVDDIDTRATVIGIGLVVNLACWALSFSLVSRMLQALGRSTTRISAWGAVVGVHWVLVFGVRSIALVDDAEVFAALVLAVAALDAMIFVKAAVHADLAMREVARATAAFDQVPRRAIRGSRWGLRRPTGPLAPMQPAVPRSVS